MRPEEQFIIEQYKNIQETLTAILLLKTQQAEEIGPVEKKLEAAVMHFDSHLATLQQNQKESNAKLEEILKILDRITWLWSLLRDFVVGWKSAVAFVVLLISWKGGTFFEWAYKFIKKILS